MPLGYLGSALQEMEHSNYQILATAQHPTDASHWRGMYTVRRSGELGLTGAGTIVGAFDNRAQAEQAAINAGKAWINHQAKQWRR